MKASYIPNYFENLGGRFVVDLDLPSGTLTPCDMVFQPISFVSLSSPLRQISSKQQEMPPYRPEKLPKPLKITPRPST